MSISRLLSYLWPIRVRRVEGRHGPLELVWENGKLVLNSRLANQSFGSLHVVWQRCFLDIGLDARDPGHVLLLGLGAGSVITILRDELGHAGPITAVEHDPAMIRIANNAPFRAGSRQEVKIIEGNAFEVIHELNGPYDLIVVDLFEDRDLPSALAQPATLSRLGALLVPGGELLMNTMAHDVEGRRLQEAIKRGLAEAGLSLTVLQPLLENFVLHGRR